MENLDKNESQSVPERDTIAALVELSKAEGHNVKEVSVWGHDSVVVPEGEVGVIPTEELNGCHVSIIAAEYPDGQKSVSMTHFPPELGARRYIESLEEIHAAIIASNGKVSTLVTLTASDRFPKEVVALTELFPDIELVALSYKARDKTRRESPDAGSCVAILDRRDSANQVLHVATDSGDVMIAA